MKTHAKPFTAALQAGVSNRTPASTQLTGRGATVDAHPATEAQTSVKDLREDEVPEGTPTDPSRAAVEAAYQAHEAGKSFQGVVAAYEDKLPVFDSGPTAPEGTASPPVTTTPAPQPEGKPRELSSDEVHDLSKLPPHLAEW